MTSRQVWGTDAVCKQLKADISAAFKQANARLPEGQCIRAINIELIDTSTMTEPATEVGRIGIYVEHGE